jgi:HTH-type transcriptional regulator/antitoxin HigA
MKIDLDHLNTPGQLIEHLMESREWSKKTLALVIGVDEAALNRVISAKRPLTADLAIALEEVFHAPADSFLLLQKKYELAQARLSSLPDPVRKNRVSLFGDLKVNLLIKRGWLDVPDDKDIAAIEKAVAKFFGIPLTEAVNLAFAAKKSAPESEATLTQFAWMYRVKQLAQLIDAPSYSHDKLLVALGVLRAKMLDPSQIKEVSGILLEAGVRLVVVESLPSAKIDGVCLWLNESQPVIGLSARFDRIDNFWFVLRHELEHVLNGEGKTDSLVHVDVDLVGKKAGDDSSLADGEIRANSAAANFCVDAKWMDSFISDNNPYFSDRKLVEFASAIKVHPGIVVGQLQNRTNRYDRFRSHLVKIRSHLVNSTLTDGWGIAPSLTN